MIQNLPSRYRRLVKNFYTTPYKKDIMELRKNIQSKKLKQNINHLSIIEILRQPPVPLFSGRNNKFVILLFLLLTVHCLPAGEAGSLFAVSYAEAPKRIISLAPNVTEILFAAGLGDKIVGVTTFCDYPPEAKQKTKIGGMSNPSLEAIITLKPDIVVMTTDGNPEEIEHKLSSMKIKTHVFEAVTLSELPGGIRKMGVALDEKEKFYSLAEDMEQAINKYKDKGQGTRDKGQKKVIFVIWPEPLIAAGSQTAVDDAINLLGWSNIAGKAKGRYPKFSIEEIIRQSPDVIFFGRGKGMDEVSGKLLKRLSGSPAVKNKKVFYVSDNLYRLGPRVIKGIGELEGYLDNTDNHR